jgi:hypothetical protein
VCNIKIFLVFIICCFTVFAVENPPRDQLGTWEPLVQSIQSVLARKPISSKNISISPNAYVAVGKKFENLRSVVNSESKTSSLKEDSTRCRFQIIVKVNDPGNAEFVTIKTKTKSKTDQRFHSVFFMKDSTAMWNIEVWSVSN